MTFEMARASSPPVSDSRTSMRHLRAAPAGGGSTRCWSTSAARPRAGPFRARPFFDAMLALGEPRPRPSSQSELVGVGPEQVALTRLDDRRLQHLARRPRAWTRRRDRYHARTTSTSACSGQLAVSGARIRTAPVRDRPARRGVRAPAPGGHPADAPDRPPSTSPGRPATSLPARPSWGRRTGLPVLADGAQSVGAIPGRRPRAFDFTTVSAQKWLAAPTAPGALVVRDPHRPRIASAISFFAQTADRSGRDVHAPKDGALRFDSPSLPMPGLAGLRPPPSTIPPRLGRPSARPGTPRPAPASAASRSTSR